MADQSFKSIISRKEAKKSGLNRYFTGRPCPAGHITERVVNNGECVKCKNIRVAAYRKRHRKQRTSIGMKILALMSRANMRNKYGISEEQYNEMLIAQNYKCALCGNEESQPKKKRLSVDHDHITGRIRGFLCGNCNWNLGVFESRRERYEKYLNGYHINTDSKIPSRMQNHASTIKKIA